MRALVVYESSFGNTGQVAEAVWEGMRRRLSDVALLDVASAPRRLPRSWSCWSSARRRRRSA